MSKKKRKNLIIGNSASGVWAAQTIRKYDPDALITIVSDEPDYFYKRCLLPNFIGGKLTRQQLLINDGYFYSENAIELLKPYKAVAIDTKRCTVTLDNGKELEYDHLLLATGSSPTKLKVPGENLKNIFGLRKIADAENILNTFKSKPNKNVLLAGAGLVSLESAHYLHELGAKKLRVLVTSGQILSQVMDKRGSEIYLDLFQKHGVEILFGRKIVEFLPAKDKRRKTEVGAVVTDQGETFPVDLVIIGKGVQQNKELAQGTPIKTDWGVLVDHHFRTSVENVFAAGDVVETTDRLTKKRSYSAIWPSATEQGKIAGFNMAGLPRVYEGSMSKNSIVFFNLPSVSLGLWKVRSGSTAGICGDLEELFNDKAPEGVYQKLVLKDDTLVGAVLLGDVAMAGTVKKAIEAKTKISHFRDLIWKKVGLPFNFKNSNMITFY